MNKYITYTVRDKNGMALLVGAISSAHPSSKIRLLNTLDEGKEFLHFERELETRDEVLAFIEELKLEFPKIRAKFIRHLASEPNRPRIYKRKPENILKEQTTHKRVLVKFTDEHQPGDKNGYLMYVTVSGQHQIVRI